MSVQPARWYYTATHDCFKLDEAGARFSRPWGWRTAKTWRRTRNLQSRAMWRALVTTALVLVRLGVLDHDAREHVLHECICTFDHTNAATWAQTGLRLKIFWAGSSL